MNRFVVGKFGFLPGDEFTGSTSKYLNDNCGYDTRAVSKVFSIRHNYCLTNEFYQFENTVK